MLRQQGIGVIILLLPGAFLWNKQNGFPAARSTFARFLLFPSFFHRCLFFMCFPLFTQSETIASFPCFDRVKNLTIAAAPRATSSSTILSRQSHHFLRSYVAFIGLTHSNSLSFVMYSAQSCNMLSSTGEPGITGHFLTYFTVFDLYCGNLNGCFGFVASLRSFPFVAATCADSMMLLFPNFF